MYYILTGENHNVATLGVYSTRKKADECKALNNYSSYHLYKRELDQEILYDLKDCIYDNEERTRKNNAIMNEKINIEKHHQNELKQSCINIIERFYDRTVMIPLFEQFDICCLHMETESSYYILAPLSSVCWLELSESLQYLNDEEISIFVDFFKLFGINLSLGFSYFKIDNR
jgi:hypothetical protein